MGETTIQQELSNLKKLELSLDQVLESYSHVQLTDDEYKLALIEAKRKKEILMREAELLEKQKQNRIAARAKWDFDIIRTFMFNRAKEIFPKFEFTVDANNEVIFDWLCSYFAEEKERFEKLSFDLGIENPSFDKGILLAGNFGTGKSVLMQLFRKNTRQVYFVREAKKISSEYGKSDDKDIPSEYLEPFKLSINDAATLYQPIAGLCIDDLGSEQVKNNFGNKSNVIGDLIERRYSDKWTGLYLHATTNLSAEELKEFYGERVVSRMREIFNFVILEGNDRRK